MSKQIEVMKLALEALLHAEDCVVLGEGGHLVVLNTYAAETVSEAITALREALAEQPALQNSPWCMKMNGCKTKCEDCPDEVAEQPAQPTPDYAWPTIADYEKEVGFEVNIAFRSAWAMARTTNDLFRQMGSDT